MPIDKSYNEVYLRSLIINTPGLDWVQLIIQSAPIALSIIDKLLGRSDYKTKLDKIKYLISVYPVEAGAQKLEDAIRLILNEK